MLSNRHPRVGCIEVMNLKPVLDGARDKDKLASICGHRAAFTSHLVTNGGVPVTPYTMGMTSSTYPGIACR